MRENIFTILCLFSGFLTFAQNVTGFVSIRGEHLYMSATEVTNLEYLNFVNSAKEESLKHISFDVENIQKKFNELVISVEANNYRAITKRINKLFLDSIQNFLNQDFFNTTNKKKGNLIFNYLLENKLESFYNNILKEEKKKNKDKLENFVFELYPIVKNRVFLSSIYFEKDTSIAITISDKKTIETFLLPDTLVWINQKYRNESYAEYYLRHPAYQDYPVVGVDYGKIQFYCYWKTQKYNQFLESCSNCNFDLVLFRLPTEKEWEYAARGGNLNANLPWNHEGFRNKTKKYQGDMLANFASGRGALKNKKGLNDNADVTAPVHSYWPNDYGLYNMTGNVAELVQQKGFSKGGSWKSYAHKLKITNSEDFPFPNSHTGFRVVMEIHKLKEIGKKRSLKLNAKFFKKYLATLKEDSLLYSKYEISNELYKLFEIETSNANKPKINLWNDIFQYGYFWAGNYYQNSKFSDYPVVNVSKKQANEFCKWLTIKYNTLKKKPYKKVVFRLPTDTEWEVAARGGLNLNPYPWGGPYIRNHNGCFLANFSPKWSEIENLHHHDTLPKDIYYKIVFNELNDEDGFSLTAPIDSYNPNGHGGYCFAGNVSEIISDKDWTRGGSWGSKGEVIAFPPEGNLRKHFEENIYEKYHGEPSPFIGFRVFMEVTEK